MPEPTADPPVLVALDVARAEQAVRLARSVAPHVGGFKVGLELLTGPGPGVVSALAELGKPVFCDAKLHDIPNTVGAAARQLGRYGARWITAHAAGGRPMLEAAVEAAAPAGILAITVLTSLDDAALAGMGVSGSVGRQVGRMARLAAAAGVEGAVCSVREINTVRQVAPDLLVVTPGIRPAGEDAGDQVRIGTPEDAVRRGAHLLVVGRAITAAADPPAAAAAIAAAVAAAAAPA